MLRLLQLAGNGVRVAVVGDADVVSGYVREE